jgi:hypothetical protein
MDALDRCTPKDWPFNPSQVSAVLSPAVQYFARRVCPPKVRPRAPQLLIARSFGGGHSQSPTMARWQCAAMLPLLFAALCAPAAAFYLPGVAPQDFKKVGAAGGALCASCQFGWGQRTSACLGPLAAGVADPEPTDASSDHRSRAPRLQRTSQPCPRRQPARCPPAASLPLLSSPAGRPHHSQGQQADVGQEPALPVLLPALLPPRQDHQLGRKPWGGAARRPHRKLALPGACGCSRS